tara:strand:- start:1085 stop:1198 length:114 start_codon:yes stop_codon:yes gene_type:complete
MENIEIWQRANGRFAMIAFWIITISYAFNGQIVPGLW